jgi:hypothetical protein
LTTITPAIFKGCRFSLRFLLLVATAAAISAFLLRPAVVRARVSILKMGTTTVDGRKFVTAVCQVTNTAHNSLWYQCAEPHDPIYECRIPQAGKWRDYHHFWCGSCMSGIGELKAGESFEFDAVCYELSEGLMIGVPFSVSKSLEDATIVWSLPAVR